MGKPITLFEHDTENFDWTDKEFSVLDRLAQKAGAELLRPAVRGGTKVLVATQYVGVFRLGNRTVQVLPKIYRREDDDARHGGERRPGTSFTCSRSPMMCRSESKGWLPC